jgi:hypothetical protein
VMLVTMTLHFPETIFKKEPWFSFGRYEHGSCVGIPALHSYHVHISSTAQGTVLRSALEGLKINQTFGAIASSASSIKIPNTLSLPSEISSTR